MSDLAGPHLLIIPSEEFVPPHAPLAGIFQYHQALALRQAGLGRIGILSIRPAESPLMILKALLFRLAGRRVPNRLGTLSIPALLGRLWDKLFFPERSLTWDTVAGLPVLRISALYLLPPGPRFDPLAWRRAGRVAMDRYLHDQGRPDLIHAHNALSAGLLARDLARRHGIPYLLTEHSSYYHQGLVPRGLYPQVRRAVAGAARYLVVSPRLGEIMVRHLGPPAAHWLWLPNVIPPDFAADPPHPPPPTPPLRFLAVGNLLPVKGHDLLLEAFARAFPDPALPVTLTVLGEGPQRPLLEAMIQRLGLDHRVTLPGEVPAEQVHAAMDRCHVVVLPSRFETFGVVVIEALARGRPVLATACGGPDRVITEADGWLTAPGDVDRLAAALQRARAEAGRFDPGLLHLRALERFGPRRFATRLGKMVEELRPDA